MALLAVAALIAASGCGGQTGTNGAMGDSAKAVPATALAYVDVNTDRGSDAWQALTELSKRFPAYADASKSIDDSLGKTSGECSTTAGDIVDAIGGDAGAALTSLDAARGGAPSWVVYLSSDDDGALKDAVESCKGAEKTGSYGGFDQYADHSSDEDAVFLAIGDHVMLIASNEAGLHDSIDLLAGKGDSLADDATFATAANGFPDGSLLNGYGLLNGYVNTQGIARLISLAALAGGAPGADASQLAEATKSLQSLTSVTFSVTPSDAGVHATLTVNGKPGAEVPSLEPSSLTDRLPADTLAFLSVKGYGEYLGQSLAGGMGMGAQGAGVPRQFRSLLRDLTALTSGDLLLYLRPGMPISAALLLKPANLDDGLATINRLVRTFTQGSGAKVHGNSLEIGPGMDVTWKKVGDVIAVGNDPQAGTPPGQTLADSQSYQDFLSDAGAPSGAGVSLYVDTPGIIGMFPGTVDPNLKHLGGIAVWTTAAGSSVTTDLFVQVR